MRKGRNFSQDKEGQLCRSFSSIYPDPIVGSGQKPTTIWTQICEDYNIRRPRGREERSYHTLETKWFVIEHVVAKIASRHAQCKDLWEFGTSNADVIAQALDLYQRQNVKGATFVYMHCWLLVKDIPRWNESYVEVAKKNHTTKEDAG